MAFTKKYRPRSFDEVVGQSQAISILRGFLEDEARPSSYLFAGPSGVGKTTCARIFAKELGAKVQDIAEVDAADLRGIDTIREMKQWAMARPFGAAKVCIFDEAHMFTKEAQNALLKILEEPPSWTYFIICTTEPTKLLQTVKSRCVRVDFSAVDADDIVDLLGFIVDEEGLDVSDKVLYKIADVCLGNVRTAVAILDKIKSLPPKKMAEAVGNVVEEEDVVIKLCRQLIKGASWKEVSNTLKEIKGKFSPEQVRRNVMAYAATVLLNKDSYQAYKILDLLRDPVYDNFPLLVLNCYEICKAD